MIENIYKYSPLREDFFDNLLVRGSQKCSLNDPFELTPAVSMRNSGDEDKCINSYFDYSVFSVSERPVIDQWTSHTLLDIQQVTL